jgi:hypothetical protein
LGLVAEQDLLRTRQRVVSEETAGYIRENMELVQSVGSRSDLLQLACQHVEMGMGGLVCEFGVWQGLSITQIARQLHGHSVFGFDSFQGLPEAWRNQFDKGRFAMRSLPCVPKNVILIKGWFDETLPGFLAKHPQPIMLLHIDSDLYSSAKTVLTLCAGRLCPGPVIVFDEYFNYPGWQKGEFKAFQEFVTDSGFSYRYLGYNHFHEQVAVVLTEKIHH